MRIHTKRIYDPVDEQDGLRVLVDRLWPRGVKKEGAQLDLWAKDLAPSPELREWFAHDDSKFSAFRGRYRAELAEKKSLAEDLLRKAGKRPVTLLFAAREVRCNHAVVLREYLEQL